jgi:hypothetical protein
MCISRGGTLPSLELLQSLESKRRNLRVWYLRIGAIDLQYELILDIYHLLTVQLGQTIETSSSTHTYPMDVKPIVSLTVYMVESLPSSMSVNGVAIAPGASQSKQAGHTHILSRIASTSVLRYLKKDKWKRCSHVAGVVFIELH